MSKQNYYTRPRQVEAAQWNPGNASDAGAVIGLVIAARESYDHKDDGNLEILTDAGTAPARPGDWVVLDRGALHVHTDEDFHEHYQAHTMRGDSSVTNTAKGATGGTLIQGGNIYGSLSL